MAHDPALFLRPAPHWFTSGTLWPAALILAFGVYFALRMGLLPHMPPNLAGFIVGMWPISIALMTLLIGGALRTLKLFLDSTADRPRHL